MENKEPLLKIKPQFNFIYEMFMPTGRKIRNTLVILTLFVIGYFFLTVSIATLETTNEMLQNTDVDLFNIFNNIAVFIIVVLAIKLIIHFVIQIWQYNCIHYTFYEDHFEYEDSFLNQHKKTLRYDNIKEIEIRRTVWDRINKYGMIVIYTNAEKSHSKGLIIYSIKNPQEIYNRIDEIVHRKQQEINTITNIDSTSPVNEVVEKENSFKESLNNKE